MPFPFVAVTLPPDTPAAYVTALLEACTQAYGEGECQSVAEGERTESSGADEPDGTNDANRSQKPTGSPTGAPASTTAASGEQAEGERKILARVSWQDPLRAEILLGFPDWVDSRWIEWHLDFKEQDQLVERHRTVGFALGRLAVTAVQVARRESDAHAAPSKSKPQQEAVQPERAAEPTPPPLQQPQATKPPVFLDPLPIPSEQNDEPTTVHAAALLGAELGAGFQGLRIGGNAGVDLVFANRFVLGVGGFFTGDVFQATFAGAELHAGVMWQPEPIEIQLCIGGGWNYVAARVDKSASEHVVGGVGSATVALANSVISPFLTLGGIAMQQGVNTNVPEVNAYGPLVPRVQVGIQVRPDLF